MTLLFCLKPFRDCAQKKTQISYNDPKFSNVTLCSLYLDTLVFLPAGQTFLPQGHQTHCFFYHLEWYVLPLQLANVSSSNLSLLTRSLGCITFSLPKGIWLAFLRSNELFTISLLLSLIYFSFYGRTRDLVVWRFCLQRRQAVFFILNRLFANFLSISNIFSIRVTIIPW